MPAFILCLCTEGSRISHLKCPNLVCKRARDRNEHGMKTASAELAVIAVRKSGGNDAQTGEL
jgi:hypothetical protein